MEPGQEERAGRWGGRKCPPNDHAAGIERVCAREGDHVCDDTSVHRWVITVRFHCRCLERKSGDRLGYKVLRALSEMDSLQQDAFDAVKSNYCDRHFGVRCSDAIAVFEIKGVHHANCERSRSRNVYPLLLRVQ